MASRAADTEQAHRRRHREVHAVVAVLITGIVTCEIVWLAPHVQATGHALAHPRWAWLAVAIAVEMVSMTTFARLQRTMLRAGGVSVPLYRAVAVTFAANAMSVTLPAGPAVSTTYTYKRMRLWGASGSLVTFSLAASGILSFITLGIIGLIGATLAGHRPNPAVLAAEVAAVIAVALALRRLTRRPDILLNISSRGLHAFNGVRRRPREAGREQLKSFLDELAVIQPDSRDWGRGLLFAALNWTADFVCLFAACQAIGAANLTLGVGLIAYAAGMAASSIPLLPGGAGLVDGAMILALSRGGMTTGLSVAGVATYRLISLVLVALLGAVAWLLVRRYDTRRREPAKVNFPPCP